MKRQISWTEQVDLLSSDSSSSSSSSSSADTDMGDAVNSSLRRSIADLGDVLNSFLQPINIDDALPDQPAKHPSELTTEERLFKKAKSYQEYMQQLPIPTKRGSLVPFTSWVGLGTSIKGLYNQPLHYLTNIRLKQWDQIKSDTGDLDTIIHPLKAEASIWLMEEIHRLTCSYLELCKLWSSDPMHEACIDSIVPDVPIPEDYTD